MSEAIKTVVRADAIATGSPPIIAEAMSAVAMVLVRCARVYIQSLLGLLSAGGLGAMPGWLPGELWINVQQAALLSCAPVVFTFLQNTVELLARLDERGPRWRA
jgi:hypothetical protein